MRHKISCVVEGDVFLRTRIVFVIIVSTDGVVVIMIDIGMAVRSVDACRRLKVQVPRAVKHV